MKRGQLRIAGAQLPVSDDVDTNVAAISRAIEIAGDQNADILLTPEGSLSGYCDSFDAASVRRALDHVVTLAASKGLGLALGTCFEEDDGLRYNQLRLYNADGALLGWHAKILLCSPWSNPIGGEVTSFATKPLETFVFKGVKVGALICNDLWANPGCTTMPNPHLAQQLTAAGIRVIFHAVSGWRDDTEHTEWQRAFHEASLYLNAAAGPVWIATVDNAAPLGAKVSSPGGLMSPDGWQVKLNLTGEQYFCADIEV